MAGQVVNKKAMKEVLEDMEESRTGMDIIENSVTGRTAIKAMNHDAKDVFGMSSEQIDQLNKTLDTKAGMEKVEEARRKGGDESKMGDTLVAAFAAFIPGLLGAALEGTEGAAAGLQGTLQGAQAGLEISKGLQEIGQIGVPESQITDLSKQTLVEKKTGDIVRYENGEFFLGNTGKKLNADQVQNIQVFRERGIGDRFNERQALSEERFKFAKTVEGERIRQFEVTRGQKINAARAKIADMWNKDPFVKASKDAVIGADRVISILDAKSKLAPAVVTRILARTIGRESGVMTDRDVAAFRGSSAWTDQASQLFQGAVSGTLTDENVRVMKKLVKVSAAIDAEVLRKEKEKFKTQAKSFRPDITDEILDGLLVTGLEKKSQRKVKPRSEREELEALRKKRRGN